MPRSRSNTPTPAGVWHPADLEEPMKAI